MVNNKNLSRFQGLPPENDQCDRKISGGPLYPTSDVVQALEAALPQLWTRKCIADVANLGLEQEDVAGLLREALTQNNFRESEWCQQSTDGPWAACDAYDLTRMEWNEHAHKELRCDYYLKFAIGLTGRLVLTISCHT